MDRILVWDWPTRAGHWLLAGAFAVAWFTGDAEEWRLFHVAAGYVMTSILAFRIVWGVLGTRYARFKSFLFTPRQVMAYLASLFRGKPGHWIGHNPAGSYAIYLLLLLGFVVVVSGGAVYFEIGGDGLEEVHDVSSQAMLYVVAAHLVGVISGSLLHRENLVRSMVAGYKSGGRSDAIASAKGAWALVLFGLAGGAAYLAFVT